MAALHWESHSGRPAAAEHRHSSSSHLHRLCSTHRDADNQSQITRALWALTRKIISVCPHCTSVTLTAAQGCRTRSGNSSPVHVISSSKGFMNGFLLKHDHTTLSHYSALTPKMVNKLLLNVSINAKHINTRRYSVWRPRTKQNNLLNVAKRSLINVWHTVR